MTKLHLSAFLICALGVLALTPSSPSAKNIIPFPGSAGLGGTSMPVSNPQSTIPDVVAEERESFSSLILADLPRPMGFRLDEMAEALTSATGVKFEPSWFRLDMAHFKTTEPFNGKEVAEKTGLEIVANYSEHLILASELTPKALQAEARVFLYDLFDKSDRRVWNALASKPQRYDPYGNRNRVYYSNNRNNKHQAKSKFENLKEGEVFYSNGRLNDPRIRNALGIADEELKYPLSSRYPLSSFALRTGSQGNSYYSSSRNFVMFNSRSYGPRGLAQWINAIKSLAARESNLLVGSVEIYAQNGTRSQSTQTGPASDVFQLPSIMDFFSNNSYRYYNGGRSYYNYYGSRPREPHPLFVSLELDQFRDSTSPDIERLQAFEKAVITASDTMNQDELHDAQRKAMLFYRRNLSIGRLTWVDSSANERLSDAKDTGKQLRDSKRDAVKMAVKKLRTWALANRGVKPRYGRLGNQNVREAYGFDWSDFSSSTFYSLYDLEVVAPSDKKLVDSTIIFRTEDDQWRSSSTPGWEFSIQLNLITGEVVWLKNEPENEESIRGRSIELREVCALLLEAVKAAKPADVKKAEWVRQAIRDSKYDLLWTSLADYSCRQMVPGFVRVVGDDPSGVFTQRAVYSLKNKDATWETLPHHKRKKKGLSPELSKQ